jgi:hypothetical protein
MDDSGEHHTKLSRAERRRRRVVAGALATAVLALSAGVPANADTLGADTPQQASSGYEAGPAPAPDAD